MFGLLTATQAIVVACVALAGAFLLDEETANQIVSSVGSATAGAVNSVGAAAGEVAGAVGGAVGDVASGLLSGIFSSPIGLIVIGVGVYMLLKNNKSEDTPTPAVRDTVATPRVYDGGRLGSERLTTLEA